MAGITVSFGERQSEKGVVIDCQQNEGAKKMEHWDRIFLVLDTLGELKYGNVVKQVDFAQIRDAAKR